MFNINLKAQSWSIDIILGAIVFMVAFLIFYLMLNANPNTNVNNLKEEGSNIIKQLLVGGPTEPIVQKNQINESRINGLKNISYDELKRILRIDNDFCIYFEDDKGHIVLINNSYKGIGSPKINLSGTPCSQK